MSGRILRAVVIGMIVLALVAACTPSPAAPSVVPPTVLPTTVPPTAVPPTAVPPDASPLAAIVQGAAERLNAGDLEGSLAYWADDAVFYCFGLPTGNEIYAGKQQIRPVWEENIGSHFKEEVEILDIKGEAVTTRTTTWHDFTRQLGVAPMVATEVYVIKDGKIASLTWTITAESLAKLKPALLAVLPPAPTPDPAAEPPVPGTALTVTIAGGVCTYDGPAALLPGKVAVTLDIKDQDRTAYALYFFTLNEGRGLDDLMASTADPNPPSWAPIVWAYERGLPGKQSTYSMTVDKGPLYWVCFSKPPDLAIGGSGPIEVGK